MLRVDVGDAEPSHGERVVLIDRLPGLRGAHRARARGEHRALDARAQRLLEDVPRAPDVHVEDADPVPASHRRRSGDVEDALDTSHRPAHRVAIGDVALGALPLHSLQRLGVAAIADEQPELVASTGQLPGDVEAHEARPTGDERLPHSVRMLESLNALDRGGRRHDLLSPARADQRARRPPRQPLRRHRGGAGARGRHRRPPGLLRAPADLRSGGDHLPALGGRLHRRLRASARGWEGDRLDPPCVWDLGHLRVRGSGAGEAHRGGQGRRADRRLRLADGRGRNGPDDPGGGERC